ncbi:glycosyltransferase [Stutzerimonas kirkiae]|nr:glycosyltransferase [Stutzerimonas kirkiae]
MHMLCDALIRSGHEAYVVADVFGPGLMTPKLTEEVVAQHRAAGLTPIAVYPEVVDGNPLQCDVVVRYLLNKPGFIEGKGEYGEDDLFFAYKGDFRLADMPVENRLFLPPIDPNIFCPPADPARRVPGRICYYLGRKARIDPQLLPADAIEITPDYPDSWQGLADIFQQCEYLYMGEASGLGYEAALCGCAPVLVSAQWSPIGPNPTSFLAFGLAPEEIARARRFLPGVRELLEGQRKAFWHELDHFIEVTQQAAASRPRRREASRLGTWLAERVPTPVQHRMIGEYLQAHAGGPRIGVVVLDPEGQAQKLKATLASLDTGHCLYASLNILVLTANPSVSVAPVEAGVHSLPRSGADITVQLNPLIGAGDFDWFMLVDAGDELTMSGLMVATLDLIGAPDCRAVYGDEVIRQGDGALGVAFRPDLNLDLLLSLPAGMSRHWLFNRQTWLQMGGFQASAGAAFELDYILRLIEAQGFQGLGHISEPLLTCNSLQLKDSADERAAILRHLAERGFQGAAIGSRLPGCYDLDYGLSGAPAVSIVILLKDCLGKAQRCLDSMLEKTAYPHYEIWLLDLGNDDPALLEWLAGIEALGNARIRVARFTADISPVQARNQAAELAQGDFLLWLDAGVAVFDGDWLRQLLNHGSRQEVGAVGAKLLDGDRRISHAGLLLGLGGQVGRPFQGLPMDSPGYLQRLQVDQNYSALSIQCLLLRRDLFLEVGGFDENPLLAPWLDADLCIRLQQAGFLNVWTPRAQLLISETPEAQPSGDQVDALYARWLPLLARDPAYNANLSLSEPGGFELADSALSWRPLQGWKPVPTVLAHIADKHGCGHYRIIQPLEALSRAGLVEGVLAGSLLSPTELERLAPDSIVLQRQVTDAQIEAVRRMQAFSGAFKVFELDDYMPNLPLKSVHRAQMPRDIVRSLRRVLSHVDRFVVSTEALAEAFDGFHADIRVAPNRLDPQLWGALQSRRRVSSRPRLGWAGGLGHAGDLALIADVVKALAEEVEWVFFGMCPDAIRPYVSEYHPGVDIALYPAALAALNLDLALAPVEQNLFNECKSNLRLLEYGACGIPVICSDVRCYQGDGLPVTRVRNRFKDWLDAIRMHLSDLDASARQGDELRAAVRRDWMLEGDNLRHWRRVWLPD